MKLEKKVAVVTGATSGIGFEISKILIFEKVKVFLVGRNFKNLNKFLNAIDETLINKKNINFIKADFLKNKDLEQLTKKLSDEKKIDFLIHSAGIISIGSFETEPVENLDKQYKVNVRTPYFITQKLLPQLKKAKGKIIFINSTAGLYTLENISQYSASKHALRALSNGLRKEIAKKGVSIISIYPGSTATPMQKYLQKVKGKPYHHEDFIKPQEMAKQIVQLLRINEKITLTDITIR